MKATVSFIFTTFRNLLGYFGLGGGNCLYYPTCSEVIRDALVKKGTTRTIFVVVPTRILVCNPIYKKFGKKWQ